MTAGRGSEQLTLQFEHRVALGVEDFLVAPSNRRAVDWIDRWPDWPFTALVLAGAPGSGKTHLAALWSACAQAERVDLNASGIEQAAELAASGRAVVIDDCDRAGGGEQVERALLRLYNLLRAANGHLLLTATTAPSEWTVRLPDLASRLNSAMVVTIDPPDDALLAAVALKLFADRQIHVAEGVIPLIVNRGERSFAGVARSVDALDRAALTAKRPITVAFAREVLNGLESTEDASPV